ncbi:MAG TPA: hypothetical protein VEH04_13800 [Verrucomicrobiae bacterium]|nr:hypothetical protein [Verrucomicrobiae bacterium]
MYSGPILPLDAATAGVRRGEISILMATRARPEMLAEELDTLQANTRQKDKLAVWLYVDNDDTVTREAVDGGRFSNFDFRVNWHYGPRPPALGQAHQALWNASGRASEVYMISCDDARFDTPGWDDVVRREFEQHSDGVLLGFAQDPNAEQATYPFIGWGMLQVLGYEKVFPGIFAFWFDDKWVEQIAQLAGRCVSIPMIINPIGGGKGKTQRMRCVPFWTRFFQLLMPERRACAEQLLNAMYVNDPQARAAAFKELEAVWNHLVRDEEKSFSDLYCVFQEERHTALSPEDRDRFNPLYIRQEVMAVTRLLSHAERLIKENKPDEALKYVEATQLADLRLRQAQDMKISCLRALNRGAEADELEREKFLSWPEMSAARRLFRFLGMIANEVRRIVAARSRKRTAASGLPPLL